MLKILRLTLTGAVFAGTMAFAALAGQFDVNQTNTGLGIRGYDPVAYFTVGAPTKGDFGITSTYDGTTYRFASEENKKMFEADPAKYLPQYGGFCAFGLANGVKVDADPELWTVADGRLFLNLAPPVQARFSEDVSGYVKTADEKWSTLKDVDPLETVK